MVVGATLESLEVSLGLAVAGVFEGVSWNLRALAERKEPIVVPQLVLVLGGLKLVSEGDTNKSELVLAKENGREVFYPTPQVLLYYNPLPPSQLLTPQRRRACPWHFILRVDVVVMRGSALNPSSFNSSTALKSQRWLFAQLLPSQTQVAARVIVLGCLLVDTRDLGRFFVVGIRRKVNSCRNKVGREISPGFYYIKQDLIRYSFLDWFATED